MQINLKKHNKTYINKLMIIIKKIKKETPIIFI